LTCPIHEHVSAGRRARALPTPPVVPVATARYGRTDATGGRRVHLRPAGPRAGRRPYAAVGTAAGDAAAQRWAAHAHRLVDVRVAADRAVRTDQPPGARRARYPAVAGGQRGNR